MNLFTRDDKPKKKAYPRKAPENLTWATTFDYMVALPINEFVDELRDITRGQDYLSTVDPKRVEFHISQSNKAATVWAIGFVEELNDYTIYVTGKTAVGKGSLLLNLAIWVFVFIFGVLKSPTIPGAFFCTLLFVVTLFPTITYINVEWARGKLIDMVEQAAQSEILPSKPVIMPEMMINNIEQHKKRRV